MIGDPRPTRLALLLAYGAMLPLPALAAVAWAAAPPLPAIAAYVAQAWAAVLLIFLAGVRRGASFFTPDGARPAQIVTMAWLFALGVAALLLAARFAFAALVVGYGSIALLDPPAARRDEVPAFFARLRPPQMAVALAGLVALLAWASRSG